MEGEAGRFGSGRLWHDLGLRAVNSEWVAGPVQVAPRSAAPFAEPSQTNGFTNFKPVASKSFSFRVASRKPCCSAVAAIRLSLIGIALP